jgi:hypothetical protein
MMLAVHFLAANRTRTSKSFNADRVSSDGISGSCSTDRNPLRMGKSPKKTHCCRKRKSCD